jgi:hypothetical protein
VSLHLQETGESVGNQKRAGKKMPEHKRRDRFRRRGIDQVGDSLFDIDE